MDRYWSSLVNIPGFDEYVQYRYLDDEELTARKKPPLTADFPEYLVDVLGENNAETIQTFYQAEQLFAGDTQNIKPLQTVAGIHLLLLCEVVLHAVEVAKKIGGKKSCLQLVVTLANVVKKVGVRADEQPVVVGNGGKENTTIWSGLLHITRKILVAAVAELKRGAA